MSTYEEKTTTNKESKQNKNKNFMKDEYRLLYLTALKSLLPNSRHYHAEQCVINDTRYLPVMSAITSMNQDTNLRFALGSNHHDIKEKNVILHDSTIMDIVVPVGFSAIFFHNRTIHGGGSSDKLNIRMFSLHAGKKDKCVVENQNYSNIITSCRPTSCKLCGRFELFKADVGGKVFAPNLNKKRQHYKLLDEMNDYGLIDHGFVIVKTSNKGSKAAYNQAIKLGEDRTAGIQFQSLGQDEISNGDNNRGIINLGSKLCSDIVMKKFVTSHLDQLLLESESNICRYLEKQFGDIYETKGKTLLRSKGIIGNQRLHLDGYPDCSCGSISG